MNMWSMCVTLEVSKVNGWLNADACCRKSNGGNMMRGELRAGRRRVAAGDGVQAACRGGVVCRLFRAWERSARGTCGP